MFFIKIALKEGIEQMGLVLNPKTIVTDFEQAAINAYKFHWPNAELKGCFFHSNQAILIWAFRNGYKLAYSINPIFKIEKRISKKLRQRTKLNILQKH